MQETDITARGQAANANQRLNVMLTSFGGKNRFDKSKATIGYEIYNNGTIQTQSASCISDYICVAGQTVLSISGLTAYTGNGRYYAFYDQNKKPILTGGSIANASTDKVNIAIPLGAYYFCFSIYQRKTGTEFVDLNTIQVEFAVSASTYAPNISLLNSTKKSFGKRILVFGDSTSETATISDDGATYTEGTRSNWPTYAYTALQLSGMYNYAKSGARYKDWSETETRQKLSEQITLAYNNGRTGDIIVVVLGTNDGSASLGDYATAMGKATLADLDRTLLYEALRWAFWSIRTYWPNAVCFVGTPIQSASHTIDNALLTPIVTMAKRYNFIVIDANSESGIVQDFEISGGAGRDLSDGLHPNTGGQQKMANLYCSKILNYYI